MNYEIRSDGVLHIDGYVNAVERDSREIITKEGRCVERVLAGVFGRALANASEVRMLLNHDDSRQLASTKDTLMLTEDAIGLRATAEITDEEVIEKARLGKLRGWSFGFKANDTELEQRAGQTPRRLLKDINLFEVSIIDDEHNPCYNSTSLNYEFRCDDMEIRTEEKVIDSYVDKWYNDYYLPRYYRFLEVRYNPYHDVRNGRFTNAEGGGMGAYTYVGKGEKGKGKTVYDRDMYGSDRDKEYEEWKKSKENSDSGKIVFKEAKTIKEAEEYAAKNFECKVSYKGIDIKVANQMNSSITDAINYCPDVKKQINAVGNAQELNKQLKKELAEYSYNKLIEQYGENDSYFTPERLRRAADKFASEKVGRVDSSTYAFFRRTRDGLGEYTDLFNQYSGIYVNKSFGSDFESFSNSVKSDEKAGYHPIGCGTVKSTFDHECGHALDRELGLRGSQDVRDVETRTKQRDGGIEKNLSRYAKVNTAEFLAEAYAESLNSPEPREAAREVKRLYDQRVKERKSK